MLGGMDVVDLLSRYRIDIDGLLVVGRTGGRRDGHNYRRSMLGLSLGRGCGGTWFVP